MTQIYNVAKDRLNFEYATEAILDRFVEDSPRRWPTHPSHVTTSGTKRQSCKKQRIWAHQSFLGWWGLLTELTFQYASRVGLTRAGTWRRQCGFVACFPLLI